jgi:iron complex outermembrane receptor protein
MSYNKTLAFPLLKKSTRYLLSMLPVAAFAQTTDTITQKNLGEVVIKAYEQNRMLQDLPAAVNYVGRATLDRYGPESIVQAVNSTPGIRMEQRSPGSYRFNIRGSSLRSPFGVRNVKAYFNDIPITDPGGTTYLNQLGVYNLNSIEIIKGPGSSLYGAGTGGVLLLESMRAEEQRGAAVEYTTGSYNMQNIYGSITSGGDNATSKLSIQHQQSDGYRNHSKMKRDVYTWNGRYRLSDKQELKTTLMYGNLFYETPGALTKAEYDANPKAARPGSPVFPSAEAANAAVYQKQFIAGASYTQHILSNLQNKTVLYGMYTDFRNATIQNYNHNTEPHFGGRTVFKFSDSIKRSALNVDIGGEFQKGISTVSVYNNVRGNADTIRTLDDINNTQALMFAQASLDSRDWTVTASGSINFLQVNFERFAPYSLGKEKRRFSNQFAPRLAIMRKFKSVNVYASVAKGFSPPNTQELIPTGGDVNLGLNAEQGTNYDLGLKGTILRKLSFDINAFIFALNNTIVQRRTAGGGDYYINSGKTKQHGIETAIYYPLFESLSFFKRSNFWLSHTWHDFHYKEFKQLNNDFSGNRMPAEPLHTVSTGVDLEAKNGLLGSASYYFSDKIPLNDANTAYANAYHLVAIRLGYQANIAQKVRMRIAGGIDNLLNQKYSLGNDVNGFGGRYYNVAAGRNFYVSLAFQFLAKS